MGTGKAVELGSRVVFSVEHYGWMEQAGIWERRYGRRAGRLNVTGEVLSVRGDGTCKVGWWRAGVMMEQFHFVSNLECNG